MRTETMTPITARPPDIPTRTRSSWLWPGIGVAAIGLIVGLVLGITTYQNSQQEIDAFARVAVPGTMAVQVDEPGQPVVYYEGSQSVSIDDLVITITDPAGAAVTAAPYGGELIYETTGFTMGRAIASFDAAQAGTYDIEVSGIATGQVAVGESFARVALPGILTALAIAGLSLAGGFALWLYSILRR